MDLNTPLPYQGTKEVMTPKTIMVTELAQMATFLPYLSDTRPELETTVENISEKLFEAKNISTKRSPARSL